jgi:hypothetical protein
MYCKASLSGSLFGTYYPFSWACLTEPASGPTWRWQWGIPARLNGHLTASATHGGHGYDSAPLSTLDRAVLKPGLFQHEEEY